MPTPPPLPRPRKSAVHRWIVRCVLLLVFVVAALVGWYAIARIQDSRVIRKLEAQVRREGKPLTLSDLAKIYPSVPDDQNAATPLLNVWQKENRAFWSAFCEQRRPLPPRNSPKFDPDIPFLASSQRDPHPGEQISSDRREKIAGFIESRSEHIAAVRAAIQRPQCQFPIVIEDGFNALLPHLNELRIEGQTVRLLALLASDRGDQNEAITRLEEIVRFAEILAAEPITISQLVRVARLEMAIRGTEDLLSRQTLTVEQLQRLEKMLRPIDARRTLRFTLEVERAAALSIFYMSDESFTTLMASTEPDDTKSNALGYKLFRRLVGVTGIAVADHRFMMETTGNGIRLADKDWPAALRNSKELYETVDQEFHRFPPQLMSKLLLPSAERIVERFARLEAEKQAALVALSVERYRLAQAGVPERLDVLIPSIIAAVPPDPFDGQPLRYRRTETNYVTYSVGPNVQDDGGNTSSSRNKGDVVFRVRTIR